MQVLTLVLPAPWIYILIGERFFAGLLVFIQVGFVSLGKGKHFELINSEAFHLLWRFVLVQQWPRRQKSVFNPSMANMRKAHLLSTSWFLLGQAPSVVAGDSVGVHQQWQKSHIMQKGCVKCALQMECLRQITLCASTEHWGQLSFYWDSRRENRRAQSMSLLMVTMETSGLDGSNPQTWFPLIKGVWTSNNGTDPSFGYLTFMLFLDQRTRGFGVFTYGRWGPEL